MVNIRRIMHACCFAAAGMLPFLVGNNAYAAGGMVSPAAAALQPAVVKTIAPSFTFTNTHHVIAGVALRNRGGGTIAVRGVPFRVGIVRAFMYWNYADRRTVGSPRSVAQLNGHRVVGVKVADNPDLCWGTLGTHTYRADVTNLLSRRPINGDYVVTITNPDAVFTNGEDPWKAAGPTTLKMNGAHLVVFYRSAVLAGPTYLYDTLSFAASTGTPATYTLTHPPLTGFGQYSMAGADGQRGGGHTNTSSNEVGKFNLLQMSGPPTAASDWDGAAGLPLPQLYDVHTHQVSFGGASTLNDIVSYTNTGDCWAPTTFVLDQ